MVKWIYSKNHDNSCRYVLGTVGENPLICIGVNPSIAEPDCLDRTIESVQRISLKHGYDSWIMINVYPQRSTDPNKMHTALDAAIHSENIHYIKDVLQKYSNADIWAAWGTLIEKRDYLAFCLKSICDISQQYNCKWITFGNRSKKGHPHHPLYLNQDATKQEFDFRAYAATLNANQRGDILSLNYEDYWNLFDNIDVCFQSITAQNGVHITCEVKYIPRIKQIVYRTCECNGEKKSQLKYDHMEIVINDPTREKILAYIKRNNMGWII